MATSPRRVRLAPAAGCHEWRLRAAPSREAPVARCVATGDVLEVLSQHGDWLQVRFWLEDSDSAEHVEGYVLGVTADGQPAFEPAPAAGGAWALLVCGGTRGSHYGKPNRPWQDLGGEISLLETLGHVYAQMAEEVGSDHVIVIAGLDTARRWLRGMASLGYSEPVDARHVPASKAHYVSVNGSLEESKRKWQLRLEQLEHACAALIARGGADHDGINVNPTTVLEVLSGTGHGRVMPRVGVSSLFLWVTTHGSAHPISVGISTAADGRDAPVPIMDEAECEQSSSLDANEWFWIMPHRASDPSAYQFVRLAGYSIDPSADPSADHPHLPLFVVYWQQMFQVLHSLFERNPHCRVVAFYQFCLAGGHLSFLQRPSIRRHWGVDKWPIYMVASAAANQNSLGATLTNIFLGNLHRSLAKGGTEPLGHFFGELERSYWKQHAKVAQMNQSLPEAMRLGEIRHYHTPEGGIQDATVQAIFSNRPLRTAEAEHLSPLPCGSAGAGPDAGCRDIEAAAEARAELLETIAAMGFEPSAVEAALAAAEGRPDLAIDLLLNS